MIRSHQARVTRRTFIRSNAALTSLVVARNARAQSLTAPIVDALTLQVVVDNATFGPFLPNQALPGLKLVRSVGGSAGEIMARRPLLAEFGLSIYAESQMGSTSRRVLIDFGYSAEVVRGNLALLGLDTGRLDATVLSHGHLDHYGGFSGVFDKEAPAGRKVPLFVGGEETFCERLAMVGTPPPLMGALDRRQLAQAGFDVRIAAEPMIVGGHAFTTGRIPIESFERAAIPTQMRPGKGCDAAALSEGKRNAVLIPDDGEHELATCFAVRDVGLIVIASCGHRGVLNSIRKAQAVSGIKKVHAVVGGFHLVRPRTDDEARRTVAELAAIDPTYVIPMHCTGEVFIAEALRVMPRKVIRPYVGTQLIFSPA